MERSRGGSSTLNVISVSIVALNSGSNNRGLSSVPKTGVLICNYTMTDTTYGKTSTGTKVMNVTESSDELYVLGGVASFTNNGSYILYVE